MKVYIGADHRGFEFKRKIITILKKLKYEVTDLGAFTDDKPCDYPDIAKEVGEHVAKDRDSRGILLCMSGIGLTIAANKVKGVYAALCYNLEAAELSRLHNNANVLVLGSKFITEESLFSMLDTWMTTPFEGERHLARVKKVMEMEEVFGGKNESKSNAASSSEARPRVVSKKRYVKSDPGNREDREERPRFSDRGPRREARSSYSTSKPSYRKAAPAGRQDENKSSSGPKRPYAKPAGRSSGRADERPSYASRKPINRGDSNPGKSSYAGDRPDRGPRRSEGRNSSGTKKPYASERSYGKSTGRSSGRTDERPSYASRKPDARSANRSERKPFSSAKPKSSSKPAGARSSGPRRKS